MARRSLPKLPKLLDRKIYKTGQTRGADDDDICQNRVSRSSTALIPYSVWTKHFTPEEWAEKFEKGYIVLISPDEYFRLSDGPTVLLEAGLILGQNALVFYEARSQWLAHEPSALEWQPATSRRAPLLGQYVARISAITSLDGVRISAGFEKSAKKGAGIRVYEYADKETIEHCRYQLEALFWLCVDSVAVVTDYEMTSEDAQLRKNGILKICNSLGLLDLSRLRVARILNHENRTICPLCLKELSSQEFFNRMKQAEGREVLDLTVTQVNLFHIEELRNGVFNHLPYNLGWGHHHCNVVVKDTGIMATLEWMSEVLKRNMDSGHFSADVNKPN